MNISSISNAIKGLFATTRSPAPEVPGALMAVGCVQKPGMSTIVSIGNIVKSLNEHGIPTDAMPDGGENKLVILVAAIVEEVFRTLREDANIQVAHAPGAISVLTNGSNSGGPLVGQGFNINFSKGNAIVQ